MSNLNNIVTVNIDIAAPAVDSASFDNLLVLGPAPAITPPRPLPVVGVYSSLSEVTDAGYVAVGDSADPVGIAARIAFSQSPKPTQIFIAAQRTAPRAISGAEIKIITEDNYLTDAVGIDPDEGVPTPNDLPWLQVVYDRQAVGSLEVEIEKDGVVVFGRELPTTAEPAALIQVVIGTALNPNGDMMNIPSGDEEGNYTVRLTATTGERTTTLTGLVYFDGTVNYTAEPVVDVTTPDTLTPIETLDAALDTTGWYVICPVGIDEDQLENIAEWTEAQIKLLAYTFLSDTDPVGEVFFRSHGWCGLITDDDMPEDVPQANAYLHVAAVAKCLSYPAGAETWAFKRLASVYPSQISSTLIKSLVDGHSNYFTQVAGRNITMHGQVRAGEWIDIIRGRDWLQNDMQLRIFNLMLMNPKIPFTNGGIALVQNEMIASLKAATVRGIVAPDEWDEDGALVPGFTTSVPNSLSITATQKAARVLQDCRFSARIAGAIHVVRVDGVLTY